MSSAGAHTLSPLAACLNDLRRLFPLLQGFLSVMSLSEDLISIH